MPPQTIQVQVTQKWISFGSCVSCGAVHHFFSRYNVIPSAMDITGRASSIHSHTWSRYATFTIGIFDLIIVVVQFDCNKNLPKLIIILLQWQKS